MLSCFSEVHPPHINLFIQHVFNLPCYKGLTSAKSVEMVCKSGFDKVFLSLHYLHNR